jgi:hypothetical protein
VLNDAHHQTYGQGRPLSYLSCTLVYIACFWDRVDFCSHTCLLWFTLAIQSFSLVTELETILGIDLLSKGLEYFFFLHFSLSFLFVVISLLDSFCSLWICVFILSPLPSLVLKHIHVVFLDRHVHTLAVSLQDAYIHYFFMSSHVQLVSLPIFLVWCLLGGI